MALKKIFVLGATGPLGIYLCQKALERGHSLTIYARNPSKLPKDISEHANAKVVEGQITDTELLSSSVSDCDVVFSALGPNASFSNIRLPAGTYTNTYRTIFVAMRKHGIKRIFIMGTPSIVDPSDTPPLIAKLAVRGMKTLLHSVWKEVVATGTLLDEEAKDLDWTMYRVGNLTNDTGVTKATKYVGGDDWNLATYRPDVADWILDQIEKETPEFVHEKPALYSSKAKAN